MPLPDRTTLHLAVYSPRGVESLANCFSWRVVASRELRSRVHGDLFLASRCVVTARAAMHAPLPCTMQDRGSLSQPP